MKIYLILDPKNIYNHIFIIIREYNKDNILKSKPFEDITRGLFFEGFYPIFKPLISSNAHKFKLLYWPITDG